MADAGGQNKISIVLAFPEYDIENRYRECVFHLKQDVRRVGHNLPLEKRPEHEELWDHWRLSSTKEEVEIRTNNVVDFWKRYAPTQMSKLAGFIGFHMRHAGYVVEAYNEGETLLEEAARPLTNMSETMHAAWRHLHGYGKPLEECVKWDLAFTLIQVHRGKVEDTQGTMRGKGPDLDMKIRAAMLKEEAKDYLSVAMRLKTPEGVSPGSEEGIAKTQHSCTDKAKGKVKINLTTLI